MSSSTSTSKAESASYHRGRRNALGNIFQDVQVTQVNELLQGAQGGLHDSSSSLSPSCCHCNQHPAARLGDSGESHTIGSLCTSSPEAERVEIPYCEFCAHRTAAQDVAVSCGGDAVAKDSVGGVVVNGSARTPRVCLFDQTGHARPHGHEQ